MSALTDLFVTQTDPVTALGLFGLAVYMTIIDRRHKNRNDDTNQRIDRLRKRIERLERRYFPDGGEIDG